MIPQKASRLAALMVAAFLCRPAPAPAGEERQALRALEEALVECRKKVTPATVSIVSMGGPSVAVDPNLMEDPFAAEKRRFFGERRLPPGMNLGSGVVIGAEGYVLTNEHVVTASKKVGVTLSDGRRFPAKVLGVDAHRDLAVVKIEAETAFAALEWLPADKVRVGQFALAVGNPWGLAKDPQPTITLGIVSAVNRSIRAADKGRDYTGLIQTDAAINPGNSGGPLVDLDGRLLGINVAIFSTTGGSQGIGFAIPFDERTIETIERLKTGESVHRPWLGVTVAKLDPPKAKALGATPGKGLLVEKVAKGGPADAAGVRNGDVLLRFGQKELGAPEDLKVVLDEAKVGRKVAVEILRNGKTAELELTVGELLPDYALTANTPRTWRGAKVTPIPSSPKPKKGVVVAEVQPDSPAWKAGLRPGEIVDEVNRKPVANLQQFLDAVEAAEGQEVLLHTQNGYRVVGKK